MRRSLVRRAGHVGVAVAAMFATSLLALPVTSAAAGPKRIAAATLVVQKVVGYDSNTPFTIHVSCSHAYTNDVQSDSYLPDIDLPFNSDGSADDSTPIPYWYTDDGAWVHDFRHGGVTCTVNETDQGNAVLVTYACNWDSGDQEFGASLGVDNPGCPWTEAGPSLYPDETGTVTLEGCGDTGTLTVYNDQLPGLPQFDPGTIPSGNPPVTTTTPVTPVTPATPTTTAPSRVAPAAAAVVAAALFTG